MSIFVPPANFPFPVFSLPKSIFAMLVVVILLFILSCRPEW